MRKLDQLLIIMRFVSIILLFISAPLLVCIIIIIIIIRHHVGGVGARLHKSRDSVGVDAMTGESGGERSKLGSE